MLTTPGELSIDYAASTAADCSLLGRNLGSGHGNKRRCWIGVN